MLGSCVVFALIACTTSTIGSVGPRYILLFVTGVWQPVSATSAISTAAPRECKLQFLTQYLVQLLTHFHDLLLVQSRVQQIDQIIAALYADAPDFAVGLGAG